MKARLARALKSRAPISRVAISLSHRERGAALAEYGFLIVLVGLAAIVAMVALGDGLAELFGFAAETFDESPGGANAGGGEAEGGDAG